MEEKLWNEFCKSDLFDSEEDRWDLIDDIAAPLKKGKIIEALNISYDWFEDVYDNIDSYGKDLTKEDIKNILEPIFHKVLDSVTEDQVIDLLENYNVDKLEVISNIFTEDEANELIAERISERNWTLKDLKEFFGIEE